MKKFLVLLIVVFGICACSKEQKNEIIKKEENKSKEIKEKYVDDNPIKVGLYENDISLVKEYRTKKENFKDIIFSVFYTNEENLGNYNQKNNWHKYYNSYTNIDNYKIGFSFSFYSGSEKIEKTLLNTATFDFAPYFYTYIYDDINQPDGTFYSHLEQDQVNDETIFSSIKIYLVDTDKITSPINITVFTYDGLEDFDENNNYRGNSKYTATIILE